MAAAVVAVNVTNRFIYRLLINKDCQKKFVIRKLIIIRQITARFRPSTGNPASGLATINHQSALKPPPLDFESDQPVTGDYTVSAQFAAAQKTAKTTSLRPLNQK